MNILHEKRKLLPHGWGNPQEPITAAVAALGMGTAMTTVVTGALIGGTVSALTGGSFLKGALMGAVFAGVGSAVSAAGASTTGAAVGAEGAAAAGSAGSTLAPVSDALAQPVIGGVAQPVATTAAVSQAAPIAGQSLAPLMDAGTGVAGNVGSNTALMSSKPGFDINSVLGGEAAKSTALTQGSGKGGLLDSLMNSGDRTKASLIQAGGNVLKGFSDGKTQEALYKQRKADARYATPVNRGLLSFKG
jgi:hypothetical protein